MIIGCRGKYSNGYSQYFGIYVGFSRFRASKYNGCKTFIFENELYLAHNSIGCTYEVAEYNKYKVIYWYWNGKLID